jgi:hypothetical protein
MKKNHICDASPVWGVASRYDCSFIASSVVQT